MEKQKSSKELYKLTIRLRISRDILYNKTKEFFEKRKYRVEKERFPTLIVLKGEEGIWEVHFRKEREETRIELSFKPQVPRLRKKQQEKIRGELAGYIAYIESL